MSDDILVLSPHLDDGVLSCGGTINALTRSGRRVVVATLFSADVGSQPLSPFARRVFHFMGLDPATGMASRRREDLGACARLGADAFHFPHHEAIVRAPTPSVETLGTKTQSANDTSQSPYDSITTLFGPPESNDAMRTVADLASSFGSLVGFGHWLVPASIGGHVDHRLVRRAAETFVGPSPGDAPRELAGEESSDHSDSPHRPALWHYEDYPYSRRLRARWRVLGLPWRRRRVAMVSTLAEEDLAAKIEAIAEYASQVEPLFGSPRALDATVRRSALRVGGERLWCSPETLAKWPHGPLPP